MFFCSIYSENILSRTGIFKRIKENLFHIHVFNELTHVPWRGFSVTL